MKLKNIIAGIAAAAVAVSAMAVNAFAATYEGSHAMSDATGWWTQDIIVAEEEGIGLNNLIGDLDPASVTSITFKSDTTEFFVGYKGTDGEWHQNSEGVVELTITDMLLVGEGENLPRLEMMISKDDGADYTISWTAEDGAPAAPAEPAPPAEPEAPADTTTAPATGNVAVASIAAVMAIAGAAAAATKKRK